MGKEWPWPGSRWWKCDLHLHTPASYDFEDRDRVTAEAWVSTAIDQGLEVVAVTDHNTAKFISKVVRAAEGKDLYVFPGVEITVNGGAHLLTLFDRGRDGDAITGLLSRCGISDQDLGKREALASCSFQDALKHGAEWKGLNIAAHVDAKSGFLVAYGRGETAHSIVCSEHLLATEVTGKDPDLLSYLETQKATHGRTLPAVTFSDAHALDQIGRRHTWIKMTRPSLEGLRLALEDGSLSVRPCTDEPGDPNAHAPLLIESVEISEARYTGLDEPLAVRFNPWLNAIIGGRGTGKSSLVEFLRIALRREDELPDNLSSELDSFKTIPRDRQDRGVLRPETELRVLYRRGSQRFRIQWATSGTLPPIEAERPDGSWEPTTKHVKNHFPVRIYSQKQIFELSKKPSALLAIIDESSTVNRAELEDLWHREQSRFLALRAKIREVEAGLTERERIGETLQDVVRKLSVFETAGHTEILREFQKRRRQDRSLDDWEEGLRQIDERLRETAVSLSAPRFDGELFTPSDEANRKLLSAVDATEVKIREMARDLAGLVERYESLLEDWATERNRWAESESVRQKLQNYEALLTRLRAEDAGDPSEYGRLVQVRQTLERRLTDLEAQRVELISLESQARESFAALRDLRKELTRRRTRFLANSVGGSAYVRMEIIPYGDRARAKQDVKELLPPLPSEEEFGSQTCSDLLQRLYTDGGQSYQRALSSGENQDVVVGRFEERLEAIKQDLHTSKLFAGPRPETFDRLYLWFPEDSLEVTYSRHGRGNGFEPLEQGSPGQKAAAILAFLLSYGEEPMILDQPEDDLDNHLISDLLVRQLRENKLRRQFIVVTHNPNIVVNADAELVLALDFRGGQTRIAESGGLQEQEVRDEVCRIMEGGREALERRYRRIGRRSGGV